MWDLRIYRSIDHPRRSTKTVHGSCRYAAVQLEDLVATVRVAEAQAGMVGTSLPR